MPGDAGHERAEPVGFCGLAVGERYDGAGQCLLDRLLGRVCGAEPVDGHQLKPGSQALEMVLEPPALRT